MDGNLFYLLAAAGVPSALFMVMTGGGSPARLHTILTVTFYTVPSIAAQHSQSKLQEFHLCLLDGNSCTIMLN